MTEPPHRKHRITLLRRRVAAAVAAFYYCCPALAVTMTEVAQHDSSDDCWSALYGDVYDLTRYAPLHPRRGGGADNVYRLCGIDGTSLYDTFHGDNREWLQTYSTIDEIGPVTEEEDPPEPTCDDAIQNGDEEGVDCGGTDCDPCPTCDDNIQNGDEEGVDCGGSCDPCPVCFDGIQNGDEEGIDCGGTDCDPCPACDDNIQNGDEEGVDCGGSCDPCPTCFDGVQNGDEEGIDCGGSCDPCPTCDDNIQNGDETGIDCGGSCDPCPTDPPSTPTQPTTPEPTDPPILPTCDDGIHNGNEEGVDCGGTDCNPCPTCDDNIQNGDEEGVDCGGSCPSPCPTCDDNIQNGDEEGIDCGGSCSTPCPTCFDGVQNGDELAVDCGGSCPSPCPTDPPTQLPSSNLITFEELAMHNTDDDCWVLYYDTVYDLTVYAWQHPGGAGIIFVDCGRDGTAAYDAYHPKSYLLEVEDDKVGIIDTPTHPPMSTDPPVSTEPPIVPTNQTLLPTTPEPTTVVTEQPGIRLEEVAEHATPEDCWVVFYEHVYDMTEYAELHPDGPGSIWPTCGTDGTKAYEVYHERDLLLAVQHYIVGPYVAESEPSSPSPDVDRVITSDELSLHNESDNCWIAYYEYVYEMSYYIHPEPSEVQSVIKTSCGSDGTKDFVKVHPKAVIKSIGKLKVGKYSMSMRMSLYIPLVVSAIGTALLVAF